MNWVKRTGAPVSIGNLMNLFSLSLRLFPLSLLILHPFQTEILAQEIPEELKGTGITEHLGNPVSIDELGFRDESGGEVRLSRYFKKGRPVLLTLVYYECPNLCSFVLNGLVKSLKPLEWVPGREFEIVTVSINPREGPVLAAKKKEAYLSAWAALGKPVAVAKDGWHFLTGEEKTIQKLASQVGFGFRYDENEKQYAHSAAIFVLTPDGKISRYLYGIEFGKQDLRLSLLEASNGKMGTVVDRILLFCYRYNPQTKKYSLYLTQLMRAGSAGTVLIFGSYMTLYWRRQRGREPHRHV